MEDCPGIEKKSLVSLNLSKKSCLILIDAFFPCQAACLTTFTDVPMAGVSEDPRGGGGGHPGFQVTGMIEWGQKKNPKSVDQNLALKKFHAEFPSDKNSQNALNVITRKIETSVLNTQKNPY